MTPPYGRRWRRTKAPLDESERRDWKSWLKTQHSKNEDHGTQSHHFMAIDGGTMETVTDFIFLGSKITADGDCNHEIKRCSLEENYDKPWWHNKKQRHHFADKGLSSQNYGFSSSHVQVWELDHKEGWAPRNWYFWTVVLEKTLESPWDYKIKPVNAKGNQPWITTGRTNAEAEDLILWLPDVKSRLTGKDPDVGKDWGQEQKGETEDEMVGWQL